MTRTGISLVLFILLAACSACRMSPEAARQELAQQKIPFSEEELFKRVENEDTTVVELFLTAGANPNAMTDAGFRITDQTLEGLKAEEVPDEVLKKLEGPKNQKIVGEEKFLDVVTTAIGDEQATKLKSLILKHAKTENSQTVLMIAARKGHVAIVEALLRAKADVNARNKEGETALHVAAFEGRTDAVKALLAKGADANAKDNNGVAPLMAAAYKGHKDTAEAFLAKGADVNAKDNKDETALMQAARQGHVDLVQGLLTKGADMNARSKEGMTALAMAFSNGHTTIAQALLTKVGDKKADGDNEGKLSGTNAHVIATGGFLPGRIDLPGGKLILEQETPLELATEQIAMIKVDWEQRNLNWYQQGFYVDDQGYIHRWQKIVKVTAEVTPKKLEVLLRDGKTLVVEPTKIQPQRLEFATEIDGAEVRLELPLKYFEADYTNEDSRRRLTLGTPLSPNGKGWKVKYAMIDFT